MLDDRMADGKTYPHAIFFGRKQWLEDSVDVGKANSDPGILDRDMHAVEFVQLGFNRQHPRVDTTQGIDGIHHQV